METDQIPLPPTSVELLKQLDLEINAVRAASMFNAKPLADKALSTALLTIKTIVSESKGTLHIIHDVCEEINLVRDELDALKKNIKTSALVEG